MIIIKYQLECTCGRVFALEAENYEDALSKMKSIMTLDSVKSHYGQEKKHKDDTVPTPEQIMAMVTQNLKEVTEEVVTPEIPVAEEKKEPEVQAQAQA